MLDRAGDQTFGSGEAGYVSAPGSCVVAVGMAIRCLEELDLAKSIVARALLAELGTPDAGRPLEETVVVTPARLLGYDAVRHACRYADDTGGFLRRQVMALRDVTFRSSAGRTGNGSRPPRYEQVALFNIVEVREWAETDRNADAGPVSWMVRGGLWAGSHLRAPCRAPLCRTARASLEAGRESAALLALRIGASVLSGCCSGGAPVPTTAPVERWLAELGRLPVAQLRTTEWARRTAEDLRGAAHALRSAGVLDRGEAPAFPETGSDLIDRWLRADATFVVRPGAT